MPINPKIVSNNPSSESSGEVHQETEEVVSKPKPKLNMKMVQLIGLFLLVVVAVAIAITLNNKAKESGGEVISQDPPTTQDTTMITTPSLTGVQNTIEIESDKFIETFDGGKINEYYNVSSFRYEVDFVSYTIKRQLTDNGIELYYLDATYKDRKVVIPVKYSLVHNLDPVGITVVQVEIASVYDSNYNTMEMITGFEVKPELKNQIVGGG